MFAICAVAVILQGNFGLAAKKDRINFSKSVKKMEEGETVTFKVRGVKNDGKTVVWSTSNQNIARVSEKGRVTAVKRGTVTITATVKSGKSVSQKLKIIKKAADPKEDNQDLQQEGSKFLQGNLVDGGDSDTGQDGYLDLEVENDVVKSLSKGIMKNASFDSLGFTECTDINNFNYSVFQKAAQGEEKNPVVSPLSAYMALALAAEGAEGETKSQFDTLLGNNMIATRLHQLTESLSKVSGSTNLAIADSVWIDDQFEADISWLSNMVSFYNAEIYQSDLCTDMARIGMNHWVSNKTRGLIPTLFEQNLSEDARLVLMNTIYMKAKWNYLFDGNSTYEREFTNENGEKIHTDFMNADRVYRRYFKTKEADGVILPYDDGRLAMIAVRPQAGQTARELAQSMTEDDIANYLGSTKDTYMNLHLPKFTVEYSLNMNKMLQQMGLTDAFDEEKADFSRLGKTKGSTEADLYISEVLQKVKVQVDEEGTEAAAVTAIVCTTTSAMFPEEEIPLEVDFHDPFVYVIVDTKTPFGKTEKNNIPLFMGIVTEL